MADYTAAHGQTKFSPEKLLRLDAVIVIDQDGAASPLLWSDLKIDIRHGCLCLVHKPTDRFMPLLRVRTTLKTLLKRYKWILS